MNKCVREYVCACGAIIRSHKDVWLPEIANKRRETLPETATPPPYVIGREDLTPNGYGERGYGEEVTSGMQPISEHTVTIHIHTCIYTYTCTYTYTYALHKTHTYTHAHMSVRL